MMAVVFVVVLEYLMVHVIVMVIPQIKMFAGYVVVMILHVLIVILL